MKITKRKKCQECGRVFEQQLKDRGDKCDICLRLAARRKPGLASERWAGLVK